MLALNTRNISLKYFFCFPKYLIAILLVLIAPLSWGNVLTTVKPIGFISSAITEGVTETEVLLPDGASPHTYSLKPSDVKRIKNSELLIWIGPNMEMFLTKLISSVSNNQKITLSDLPSVKKLMAQERRLEQDGHDGDVFVDHEDDHYHGDDDQHLWMSPSIALEIAKTIHDQLVQRYPAKRELLDINLQKFTHSLMNTQELIEKNLKPVQNKAYFVFHDGYGYFEHRFNLSQLGYFTLSPDIQPGAKRVNRIRQELLAKRAVCIFSEPQFNPAIIETIIKQTDVKHGVLDPLGMSIPLGKESYMQFLNNLAHQFNECLSSVK